MVALPADLPDFLAEKRDSREYRRALAVKLAFLGYRYEAICETAGCDHRLCESCQEGV